jgi:outer membrane biosynthesis protein TonB
MQSFRPSLAISAVLHAVILLWGLVWFAPKPLDATRTESMAIDLVPISEFTINKAGSSKAPPKPDKIAEAKGDPKELTDLVKKVSEKDPIKAATPPPPAEEKKPAEKAAEKSETKPEPKPDPKEALKTPEPPKKPEPPKEQPKTAAQQMKAAPTKREFDPNQIAALLDRRDPQRQKVTSLENPASPSRGFTGGQAATLSISERDAFFNRLYDCWHPPAAAYDAENAIVILNVSFRRDASLARPPETVGLPPPPLGPSLADSAKRALLSCQPFTMLKPEHYEQWQEMELTFDLSKKARPATSTNM